MQPENNVANDLNLGQVSVQENVMTQRVPSGKVSGEKSKMSKKQIVGLVVLSLIAIGGVLFGVYGMNSQNEQIAQLTVRATDAEGKVAQLETEKITITDPDGGTTEITDSVSAIQQNPIITTTDSQNIYQVMHTIPVYIKDSNSNSSMNFYLEDGQFKQCFLSLGDDCNVSGLPSDLYKMATIYEGNGMGNEKIGFLTSDGIVYYAPIYNGSDANLGVNTNFAAKKANIDGFVKDIISINFGYANGGGYASTVFVMGDNSLVKYDESMFK